MTTSIVESPPLFSQPQIDLIKRTICKGATDDEFALFLRQCERTRLDPFARQIHAVKRWNTREQREVMSIQVGIDGFRLIAERTGCLDGQDGAYWCGADGKWADVWLLEESPQAAKVVVYRKGCARAFTGVAHWSEYAQTYFDKKAQKWILTNFWQNMPRTMLAKVAEAIALRKAFPQELSGLYVPEELRSEPEESATEQTPSQQAPAEQPSLPAPAPVAAESQVPAQPTARQRVAVMEEKMVERSWCQKGELIDHLVANIGLNWAKAPAEAIERESKNFHNTRKAEARKVTTQEMDQLEKEIDRTGESFARVILGLQLPRGTAASSLSAYQWRQAMDMLEEMPDRED